MTRGFSPATFWSVRFLSLLAVIGIVLFLQFWLAPTVGTYGTRLLVLSLLFGTLAVSLNMINGITGQFSIGHAAFYLVGAYTAGKLTKDFYAAQPLGGDAWLLLVVVLGGIAAGITGLIVGLPSLRLRGDYLAIVTLGFGEIARIFVVNQTGGDGSILGLDLGGSFGMSGILPLTNVAYVGLLFILTIFVSRNLLKTAHGLAFLAVREDELAAEATGVRTTKTKVIAFILGATIAGMAGALFAHYEQYIRPEHFDMTVSFIILTMVVIGGTGSITGAAIAGIGLTLLQEALRNLPPVAALTLLSFVIGVILTLIGYHTLRRTIGKSVAARPAAGRTLRSIFAAIGVAGCLGGLYLAYLLLTQEMSLVIKSSLIIIIVATAGTFLLSSAGRRSLPVFGGLVEGLVVAFVLQYPVSALLHSIPFVAGHLAETTYTPSNLRMAVFALALVTVMLSRPQGLFGHHELSWDAITKSLLGKKLMQDRGFATLFKSITADHIVGGLLSIVAALNIVVMFYLARNAPPLEEVREGTKLAIPWLALLILTGIGIFFSLRLGMVAGALIGIIGCVMVGAAGANPALQQLLKGDTAPWLVVHGSLAAYCILRLLGYGPTWRNRNDTA